MVPAICRETRPGIPEPWGGPGRLGVNWDIEVCVIAASPTGIGSWQDNVGPEVILLQFQHSGMASPQPLC